MWLVKMFGIFLCFAVFILVTIYLKQESMLYVPS
jgi:fermentation-respiration switch protein FrsA (DUF1100 family)